MDKRIFVTEPGYDDIGSILENLGEGFGHKTFFWTDNISNLKATDVLFVNCSNECSRHSANWKVGLKSFVERGGTIYASDYGGAFIQEAFPQYLEFSKNGDSGETNADVVDSGLRELLGTKIKLHFDLGGWWKISKIKEAEHVNVLIQTNYGSDTYPLLVHIRHGSGNIIFTSFHNHAQVSGIEEKLLRYLVLRPLMSAEVALSKEVAEQKEIENQTEYISTIAGGLNSKSLGIDISSPSTLVASLRWENNAELELRLIAPNNLIAVSRKNSKSPILIEKHIKDLGEWKIEVAAIWTPYDNSPYLLTYGIGGISNTESSSFSTTSSMSENADKLKSPLVAMTPIGLSDTPLSQKTSASAVYPPELLPIQNWTRTNSYVVRWIGMGNSDKYVLEEANSGDFDNPYTVYEGEENSFWVKNKSSGEYYYRVYAKHNDVMSPASNCEKTEVLQLF